MYFVITNSDGDISMMPLEKEDLLKKLNEKYWGDIEFKPLHWLQNHGLERLDGAILIKGHIVIPLEKETVVEFDVP